MGWDAVWVEETSPFGAISDEEWGGEARPVSQETGKGTAGRTGNKQQCPGRVRPGRVRSPRGRGKGKGSEVTSRASGLLSISCLVGPGGECGAPAVPGEGHRVVLPSHKLS